MYEISVVKTQVEKFCETHTNKCVKTKFDSGCGTCEFDIGDCILVVVYNEPDFAPYYMLSIEVVYAGYNMPVTHKSPPLVYFYYDSPEDEAIDILRRLDEAYEYAESFSLSTLNDFVGKRCKLKDNWIKGVHPDDSETIPTSRNVYQCIGTFAQYYIIETKEIEFRILGDYLEWVE